MRDKKFAYINFFDERLLSFSPNDYEKLMQAFYELYGDVEYFVFDEIQSVKGWERFLSRIRTTKKIIVTGSSSSLLSGELSTSLTGRYVGFTLYPFSFREFLKFKGVKLEKTGCIQQKASRK
ncbi:AAA family ATPase [Pyrococcus kukulkanii]|uniref:AAA family ATPase n=1 Tax=Pyrococcus kukulkanii TaxID=1609559 RepID=UPI003565ACA6